MTIVSSAFLVFSLLGCSVHFVSSSLFGIDSAQNKWRGEAGDSTDSCKVNRHKMRCHRIQGNLCKVAWLGKRTYGCSRVQIEHCEEKAEGSGRVCNPFPILLLLKFPELLITQRVRSSENLDPQGNFSLFCLLFAFWAFDWFLSLYLLLCIPLERINAVHAWCCFGSVAFKPYQCQMSL